MPRTEQNVQATEDFIRKILAKNFRQSVDPDALRNAAEKLCDAVPARRVEAA